MQKGLATLEIILVTLIIGVLVKVAVPNVARIIDAAALDYEYKRLYSELRFAQEMGRSNIFSTKGTGDTQIVTNTGTPSTLFIEATKNYYQVFRGKDKKKKALREPHYLSYGVKIKLESGTAAIINVDFDSDGGVKINDKNGDALTLTSRFGKKRYIIFNSVGRMRASFTPATE